MQYELIIIWDTGEKATETFESYAEALQAEKNMRLAFGRQINWSGINEVRRA